eukprot:8619723-Pyramimonas_sp.AAC.1
MVQVQYADVISFCPSLMLRCGWRPVSAKIGDGIDFFSGLNFSVVYQKLGMESKFFVVKWLNKGLTHSCSLTVAMSIDYSLFLASRFVEEAARVPSVFH